jgi:hypothetical protein
MAITPAVAGTYAGTSTDGNSVQFVVGTDTNNGEMAVTAATIFFSAPYANSTYVLDTGWGIGTLADINANNRVTIEVDGGYYAFTIGLHFAEDGQASPERFSR